MSDTVDDQQLTPVAWLPVSEDIADFVRRHGDGEIHTSEELQAILDLQYDSLRDAARRAGCGFGLLYRTSVSKIERLGWGEKIATAEGRAWIAERLAGSGQKVLGLTLAARSFGWALVLDGKIRAHVTRVDA